MRQEASRIEPGKAIDVEFMKLDLSSFKSVKDFTVAFKEKNIPLHILINNAGIFHAPFSKLICGGLVRHAPVMCYSELLFINNYYLSKNIY